MYISNIWEFLILPSWICNINALKSLYSNPTQKTFISTTHTCGGGNGTPLHYFCLENPMDGGAWWAPVHGVAKSRTWLSDFTFTFHFHALKKEMATHSSVLAWRTPWTGKPGGPPSMGLHRVGHDWSDLAAAAAAHTWYFDSVSVYHSLLLQSRDVNC